MKSVAIISGAGGEHKSRLAIYMAGVMSYFGQKVLLVDADLNSLGASIKLGLNWRNDIHDFMTVSSIFAGNLELSKIMSVTLTASFNDKETKDVEFDVLPASDFSVGNYDFQSTVELQRFTQRINELAMEVGYDLVIYDCSSGLNAINLRVVTDCNRIILLCNKEAYLFRVLVQELKAKGLVGKALCILTPNASDDNETLDRLARDCDKDKPLGCSFYKESLPFYSKLKNYYDIHEINDHALASFAHSIVRELFDNAKSDEIGPEWQSLYEQDIARAKELDKQIIKVTRRIWYKFFTIPYHAVIQDILGILSIGFFMLMAWGPITHGGDISTLADEEYRMVMRCMYRSLFIGVVPVFSFAFIFSQCDKVRVKVSDWMHEVTQIVMHLATVLGEDTVKSMGLYKYVSK